jgi:hypothetical protein
MYEADISWLKNKLVTQQHFFFNPIPSSQYMQHLR